MALNGKWKSVRCLVTPFLEGAFLLESVKRAVHFDGSETFRAKPKPCILWPITVETSPPSFVIPAAGADVRFAGHSIEISNLSFAARFLAQTSEVLKVSLLA